MKNGWEIKTLNQISENLDSKRVPITKNVRMDGSIPYYGASGIVDYVSDYIFDEDLLCISEDGANLLARTYPIAFSISGKTWVNNHAHVLKFTQATTQRFVELYLNSIKLDDFVSGMAQPKLNQTMLNKIPIPLPTLPEQKRIVTILDQAFAAIDKAKANAEKNLKNAREVFESYLQGVFENKGDDWEEKTLGEVCEFRNGQAHEQHIDEKGKYILVNSKFISSDGEKGKRTNNALSPLFIGDIVFVMSDVPNGKALAKCFLIDKNDTYTLNQRIGAICSKVFDNDFLVYQFNRHKYLLSFNNGENQTNLRKNDILNCPIYNPQLTEQKTIVKKLDDLSSETKKLEVIYQNKITDLEELKKSILQKAFSGELKTDKVLAI